MNSLPPVKLLAVFWLMSMSVLLEVHLAWGQPGEVSRGIEELIESSRAADALWAVSVRDSSGQVLAGYNAEKIVRPASNLKLLTSAMILDELGSDYRFKTRMFGYGTQRGDVWDGDIIIEGRGDPSISGRFYNDHRFYVFEQFFNVLDSLGIRTIEGNLIGNNAFFEENPYPKGWNWDDLSFYYGVEIDALSFNNNAVDLQVYAQGEVGQAPRIHWFPFDTDYVEFINEQIITPPNTTYDEYYRRLMGTNTILLRSRLPQNYYEEESLSVNNASLYFMDTFKKYLESGGVEISGRISVDGQPRDWDREGYAKLYEHRSVPLSELLKEINKESSNFYTEMLFRTAAAERFNVAGNTSLGRNLVKRFADEMQVDTTRMEITDASGMSPSTLLKADEFSRYLAEMQHHPEFDTFFQSLSIGGVDGSLGYRFRDTPLVNRVFGKTGYVSGVRSLSGYLTAISGQRIVFSIFTNNYTSNTGYIDSVQEQIVEHLYKEY